MLLIMIIGLVSCDDNVASNGEPNGAPFDYTKTLPKTREQVEEVIQSIKNDLDEIKDALNMTNPEGIDLLPEGFGLLKSDLYKLRPNLPDAVSYQFGLYGNSSKLNTYGIKDATVTSATGFFTDKMIGPNADIAVVVDAEFKIDEVTEGKPDICGSYEISLNGSYVEDADGITPTVHSGTLEFGDGTWNLTTADVLLDEDNCFDWDQDGAERHQRILTIFIYLPLTTEEYTMTVFYDSVKGDGFNGEFVEGYTVFDDEGGAYTSATWKDADGQQYSVLFYKTTKANSFNFMRVGDDTYKIPT